MDLPLYTRAAAFVVACSTAASIIVTVAEMGHPPPDGRGVIESLLAPQPTRPAGIALVTGETLRDARPGDMPQP